MTGSRRKVGWIQGEARRFLPVLVGLAVVLLWLSQGVGIALGDDDHCGACGALLVSKFYRIEDKLTGEKVNFCTNCVLNHERCFVCGLPTKDDDTKLDDGRVICSRDLKTAVLDQATALQVCHETSEALVRLLSRFMWFPETNVSIRLMDRVNLQAIFKKAGNDYGCPNVMGCTLSKRGAKGRLEHSVSLLSGMPALKLKATCAHELTHAWLNEHLPAVRRETLDSDAVEGFCEFVAYYVAQNSGDEQQVTQIKANAYTSGQIDLFIEAERTYGIEDVIDWMLYGTDGRLVGSDLGRIRNVELPKTVVRTPRPAIVQVVTPAPAACPGTLVLKGLSGTKSRPFALINDHTFEENEQASVRVGGTNLAIKCVSIRGGKVKVQVVGSRQMQELELQR